MTTMELPCSRPEKVKLKEVNPYLTCYLCKGYLIDATTISECLHSFCRSCIIKFLQENSYCPICEVIINKAKPNLKLDKTLQDIVYKLVPELFLREMTRRKCFYQQYPQIAARMSPEERGEDTERTIYNPQDCISLSMEYISDDSAPGAIQISKTDKNGNDESPESIMKRYLQCPGMCRVEVLKKFVRNKYSVDTSKFHIDVLYKRVPLPDHYTLIDIAYIYAWKRNEPMKFFFRITDINKVNDRFDSFAANKDNFEYFPKIPSRHSNGSRTTNRRRTEHNIIRKSTSKVIRDKQPSQMIYKDPLRPPSNEENNRVLSSCSTKSSNDSDKDSIYSFEDDKKSVDSPKFKPKLVEEIQFDKNELPEVKKETTNAEAEKVREPDKTTKEIKQEPSDEKEKMEPPQKSPIKPQPSKVLIKPEIIEQLKNKLCGSDSTKKKTYTNITLDRTDNVEIITRIQQVQNKEGHPIGHQIIKTVRKAGPTTPAPKKLIIHGDQNLEHKTPEKPNDITNETPKTENDDTFSEEKCKFLKSIELTARTSPAVKKEQPSPAVKKEQASPAVKKGQPSPSISSVAMPSKRKNSSPVKNEKTSKRPKLDKKTPAKIIITEKPSTTQKLPINGESIRHRLSELFKNTKITVPPPNDSKPPSFNSDVKPIAKESKNGLQSLIDSCKINIPSSLSITIKEGSENNQLPTLIPPVKNYIEILKLPGDETKPVEKTREKISELASKFCDNDDDEQKVDQELAEIAKSLTEKIPNSTTVSHIIAPKPPQFPIPVKNTPPQKTPLKTEVEPSKDSAKGAAKLSQNSFQKIFEESIKKPASDSQKDASDQSGAKRNSIAEIAAQLQKKTKLEQEKPQSESSGKPTEDPPPKIPIPRLPNLRTATKPDSDKSKTSNSGQIVAKLHSTSLGLNYSVSIGQKSPIKPSKLNGIVSSPKKSPTLQPILPKPESPKPLHAKTMSPPVYSPKHSPKSSPVVKHMYAPMPGFNQRVPSPLSRYPSISPKPISSPKQDKSPGKMTPKSPKTNNATKAGGSSKEQSPLTPNEILEKYKIQDLAQLTASLNFNSNFSLDPATQLAALQQAMLLNHLGIQNRQSWLSMNQGPLLQYEKYLQSLNGSGQGHLMTKEN